MRVPCKPILFAALALPMLGGCHSLFGRSSHARVEGVERNQLAVAEAGQMEAGRAALRDGRYAEAITAFRQARLSPLHAADAANGLGVAYSNIGRPDLAERYFRQAMAYDPQDARFAANLARLFRANPAYAMRAGVALPALAEAAPPAPPARPQTLPSLVRYLFGGGGKAQLRIELPATRMVRVSQNEVRVGTGAAGGAWPAADRPARVAVRVESAGTRTGRASTVRVTAGGPVLAASGRYPVKVGFGSPSR